MKSQVHDRTARWLAEGVAVPEAPQYATITGTAGDDDLIGTSGDDVIDGLGGNDVIRGGGGVDLLIGGAGNDRLIAGPGVATSDAPDLIKGQSQTNGSIATAVRLTTTGPASDFDLVLNPDITESTTLPHATIVAVSHGGREYYEITVTAGARLVLDIDGADFDATLRILDSTGAQIAANDDAASPDGGLPTDPQLSHLFTLGGTFYIEVARSNPGGAGPGLPTQAPSAGSRYTLHVSTPAPSVQPTYLQGSRLVGGDGDDWLVSGSGRDRLEGGAGFDVADFSAATGAIQTNFSIRVEGSGGYDEIFDVEGIVGTAFNDTIRGWFSYVDGGAGNDFIQAEGGDSRVRGGAGSDFIFSGAGHDVSLYDGLRQTYQVTRDTTPVNGVQVPAILVAGGAEGGRDTLTGVEELVFIDGTLRFDEGSLAAQLMRLYSAAFDREPDPLGFHVQLDALEAGVTLTAMAQRYLDSAEFTGRFGPLTDVQYIQRLYANALNRQPSNNEINDWLTYFNNGGTRAGLLQIFAESTEHRELTAATLARGLWVGDSTSEALARLYDAAFDRQPDPQGFMDWRNGLGAGLTLVDVATAFLASTEGQARWGGLSNAQFVDMLYQTALGRAGDPGGVAAYNAALNAGALTRAQMMVEFAQSDEARALYQHLLVGGVALERTLPPSIITGTPGNDDLIGTERADLIEGLAGADRLRGMGGDDRLVGGDGDDVLEGGEGADRLEGGDGADDLNGGAGDDYIDGGAGNDIIRYDEGNDFIDGGAGWDILDLGALANPPASGNVVHLGQRVAYNNRGEKQVRNIEEVWGTAGADILVGDDLNNVLRGMGDADRINSAGGNDVLEGRGELDGGAGDDILIVLGRSTVIGGLGFDVADYSSSAFGLRFEFGAVQVNSTGASHGTYSGIDAVIGTAFDDVITFNTILAYVDAGAGDDVIGRNAQFVRGGAGSDVILGFDGGTALYDGLRRGYATSLQDSTLIVSGGLEGGQDTVHSRKAIFIDGMLSYSGTTAVWTGDATSEALFRLYDAAFDRLPGQEEFVAARNAISINAAYGDPRLHAATGTTLLQTAQAFLGSPEGQARWGGTSNAQFVAQLFQTAYGREGTPSERATYTGQLDAGTITRAQLMLDFAQSSEARTLNAPLYASGVPFQGMLATPEASEDFDGPQILPGLEARDATFEDGDAQVLPVWEGAPGKDGGAHVLPPEPFDGDKEAGVAQVLPGAEDDGGKHVVAQVLPGPVDDGFMPTVVAVRDWTGLTAKLEGGAQVLPPLADEDFLPLAAKEFGAQVLPGEAGLELDADAGLLAQLEARMAPSLDPADPTAFPAEQMWHLLPRHEDGFL